MRVLLDESLPRPLAKLLVGHEVQTVTQVGWTSLDNGALLRRAAEKFDVVLTADQNIEFQQNVKDLPVAVVVLVAPSNRLESLDPLIPKLLQALNVLEPKTVVRVGASRFRMSRAPRRQDRTRPSGAPAPFGGWTKSACGG